MAIGWSVARGRPRRELHVRPHAKSRVSVSTSASRRPSVVLLVLRCDVRHQNADVWYFRRSLFRTTIAVRFSRTTIEQQQERRRVHHRLGRLDVRALESDVDRCESRGA